MLTDTPDEDARRIRDLEQKLLAIAQERDRLLEEIELLGKALEYATSHPPNTRRFGSIRQ